MYRFIVVTLISALTACGYSMDYYHSPNFNSSLNRFQHPDGDPSNKKPSELFAMMREFSKRKYDQFEHNGFPVEISEQNEILTFSDSVMWIGQSTTLLNYKNLTVLTDPQFSNRASPLFFGGPKRVTPTPFKIGDLPNIDVVLISHNHYDHLDRSSIKDLVKHQPSIKFMVPLGLAQTLYKWGAVDVTELDWWQAVKFQEIEIQATPVKHWSSRSLFDRNKSLWAGWMIKWDDFSFYFAGDSGYSGDFKETAKRLGSPTLAAIPIGAYEPRHLMKDAHMHPEEAVKAFEDLQAKYGVAIHWGTFKLTTERMDEPPERLLQSLKNQRIPYDKFRALSHGEKWDAPFAKKM